MTINEIIYRIGSAKRNPSLKDYYLFLKESENWSIEQLLKYQFDKCKSFLIFVNQYSPHYNEVFKKIGFIPQEMSNINNLNQIPSIDKTDLLKNVGVIHTKFHFKKLFAAETSGTSGQSLKFFKNEEWDSGNRAAIYRGYSWYGISAWEKNGYFWGYNIDKQYIFKTKLLDFLQNRFRLFSYDEKEIMHFVKNLINATYLHGYSSMIYEVAKIVNRLELNGQYKLKMIKGTSEKIYDSYQEEVKQAFGLKIISEYGAAEAGIIAFECPYGNMHINIENVIVEEENGEIIVTNLLSKSFPIIRYRLRDSIRLLKSNFKCRCGKNHPIIIDVLGRVGKKVIGYKNIYPSLTFYYVFKNLALNHNIILNYQAIQNEIGCIILNIEQSYDLKIETFLRHELFKYFSNDITFCIRNNQQLHTMNGKLKDFISNIE
jgi:phenylacetate-CoA ligase